MELDAFLVLLDVFWVRVSPAVTASPCGVQFTVEPVALPSVNVSLVPGEPDRWRTGPPAEDSDPAPTRQLLHAERADHHEEHHRHLSLRIPTETAAAGRSAK